VPVALPQALTQRCFERLALCARLRAPQRKSARPARAPDPRRQDGFCPRITTALIWKEGPISKNHDRAAFDCGEDNLNTYMKRYARQNHESGGAKCFVVTPRIIGFYTLSPASVEFSRAPAVITRGLARYEIPVYRLGRLARSRTRWTASPARSRKKWAAWRC
jgi:hypothetical protein